MSAQPQQQPKQDKQPRSQRPGNTETRLTIVETQWEAVIPTLATKADLSDLRADLSDKIAQSERKAANDTAEVKEAVIRLESAVREMRADIKAEIKSDSSNQLKWVVGTMLAGFLAVIALMFSNKAPQTTASVQQSPAVVAPAPIQPVQPVSAPVPVQPATANEQ